MDPKRLHELEAAWSRRQDELGNQERAVLFKSLPAFINHGIHRAQTRFVLDHLPSTPATVLDVGCGYGRLSREIRKGLPKTVFSGVDICPAFARSYAAEFGNCFLGPAEAFEPTNTFDVILMVTVLMYQEPDAIPGLLERYWGWLNPGGRMICIEPSMSWMIRLRRHGFGLLPAPTGREVHYFQVSEFLRLLDSLPGGDILAQRAFGFLPLVERPRVHLGAVVEKAP